MQASQQIKDLLWISISEAFLLECFRERNIHALELRENESYCSEDVSRVRNVAHKFQKIILFSQMAYKFKCMQCI